MSNGCAKYNETFGIIIRMESDPRVLCCILTYIPSPTRKGRQIGEREREIERGGERGSEIDERLPNSLDF